MKYGGGKAEAIRKQARLANQKPPEEVGEYDPEIDEAVELYWEAFHLLSTCRSIGMGEGPIPWTAITAYIDRLPDGQLVEQDMIYFIMELDNEYLKIRAKQAKKQERKTNG